ATYNLARLTYNGQGVDPDRAQAIRLYEKAAQAGQADAQFTMGLFYAEGGYGISQSWPAAVAWWREAAGNGHLEAQYLVGNAYHDGDGVTKSHDEAMVWWTRAAKAGYAPAMMKLGEHFADSEVVKRDLVRAYLWYDTAVVTFVRDDRRSEAALKRDAVAARMSGAQRQQAAQLAETWKALF
ncbi:MAG TPA: tetratricopeptide repeat protein, partial [Kiloniellaceae bacterium]|nr:tetratricopeptide repeat protein [Kiloniellaceae bacterium]